MADSRIRSQHLTPRLLTPRGSCASGLLWLDPPDHQDLGIHHPADRRVGCRCREPTHFPGVVQYRSDVLPVAQFFQNVLLPILRLLYFCNGHPHACESEGES
jgi:hypothetical protein